MRFDKLFHETQKVIEHENLEHIVERLTKKCEKEEVSIIQFAAALIKRELGEDSMIDIQEDTEKIPAMREYTKENSRGKGTRTTKKGYERLFVNIGTKSHIRPGDILGAFAGEAHIAGRKIGSIDMYEKFSFVEVPKDLVKKVLQSMNKAKIKGKSIHVELANK